MTDQGGQGFLPGITYRGQTWANNWLQPTQIRGSASYVTGTHTLKVGFSDIFVHYQDVNQNPNPISYTFTNGTPISLTQSLAPLKRLAHINTSGYYAQDSVRLNRLTLQGGVRLDHMHSSFPQQVIGPDIFSGQNTAPQQFIFPETEGASVWDITPRMAATWDVMGDGKTAVKVSLGKYLAAGENGVWGENENPTLRLSTSATRAWKDSNTNFVPDCNLLNPAANGECGADSDQNFGTTNFSNTYDPALRTGWGHRSYNWEFSTGVQREIVPRVSAEFLFFRRSYGNQVVTENLAYNGQFGCGTPTRPLGLLQHVQLHGSRGSTPAWRRRQHARRVPERRAVSVRADAELPHLGEQLWRDERYWQGLDLNVTARGFKGLTLQGGISSGRTTVDECALAKVLPEVMISGQTLTFNPVLASAQTPLSALQGPGAILDAIQGLGHLHRAAGRHARQLDVAEYSWRTTGSELQRAQRHRLAVARAQPLRQRGEHRAQPCGAGNAVQSPDQPAGLPVREDREDHVDAQHDQPRFVQLAEHQHGEHREPDLHRPGVALLRADRDHSGAVRQD